MPAALSSRSRLPRRALAGSVSALACVTLLGAGLTAPAQAVTSGATSGSVAADVEPAAPEVTRSPEPVAATSGDTVTLSARATGEPAPTVQWLVSTDDGETYAEVAGATSPDLTFTPSYADGTRVYKAVFTNEWGTADSDTGLVTVDPAAPVVTRQPQDTSVEAGSPATFRVEATGDPAPEVTWQALEPGASEDDWYDLPPLDDQGPMTMTYPSATLAESGTRFRARLVNEAGEVLTEAASMTVTGELAGAPTDVTATDLGGGRVRVTWKAPASLGTAPFLAWAVSYDAGQYGDGVEVDDVEARSFELTGLTSGRFTFGVSAVTLAGPGPRGTRGPVTVVTGKPSVVLSHWSRVAGQQFTVSGVARSGSVVVIQRALPGQSFRELTRRTAGAGHTYAATLTATRNATYRARLVSGATSSVAEMEVRTRVSLAATRVARRTYVLSGTVYPAASNQLVKLYEKRSNGSRVLLGQDRTDSRGRYALRKTFASTRSYSLAAVASATTLNASGQGTRVVAVR